jgi:site-specific recombinase XerD
MLQFDFSAIRSIALFANLEIPSSIEMAKLLLSAKRECKDVPKLNRPRGIAALIACVPGMNTKDRNLYADLIRGRLTAKTAEAYAARYVAFEKFCRAKNMCALPTSSRPLAAFIAHRLKSVVPRTVQLDLCAIRLVHEIAGYRDPASDEQMRELIIGVKRSKAPGRLRPVTMEELRSAVKPLKDLFIFECRDRCLMLVIYGAGLMVGTARSIDRSEITFDDDGSMNLLTKDLQRPLINVRPGKFATTCPVSATKNWLKVIGTDSGPLFPAWDARGAWIDRPISATKIYISVKERLRRVGVSGERICARSLRQGFMIAASRHASPVQVSRYVGLKSVASLEHHIGRLAINKKPDSARERIILKRRWAPKRPAS